MGCKLRVLARVVPVGACLVGLACGCVTRDAVRDCMAERETCPPANLDVRVRDEIDPTSYVDSMMVTPNAEIAADPVRLGYWRQQQAKLQAEILGGTTVFEIAGCGFRGLAACKPASRHLLCRWLRTDAAIARGHLQLRGSEGPPPSQRAQ